MGVVLVPPAGYLPSVAQSQHLVLYQVALDCHPTQVHQLVLVGRLVQLVSVADWSSWSLWAY